MTRTMERVLSGASLTPPNGRLLLLHADEDTARAVLARGSASRVLLSHRSLSTLHTVMRSLGIPSLDAPTVREGVDLTAVHAHGRLSWTRDGAHATFDSVVMRVPTDVRSAHLLLLDAARALPAGALVYVLGGTNEGIRSLSTVMQGAFDAVHTAAHAGGMHLVIGTNRGEESAQRLHALCMPYDDPAFMTAQHVVVPSRGVTLQAYVRPGVFSFDRADEATLLLAEHMSIPPDTDVLDLGCGSGILGAVALAAGSARSVTLVDADCEAVRCATRTMHGVRGSEAEASPAHDIAPSVNEQAIPELRALWRVLASDVTSAVRGEQFDVVVSNPPFHTGKATDLALPTRFIQEAAAVLREGGILQLVANRTLPYEVLLEREFGNRRVVHDGRRFKVLEARVTRAPSPTGHASSPQRERRVR